MRLLGYTMTFHSDEQRDRGFSPRSYHSKLAAETTNNKSAVWITFSHTRTVLKIGNELAKLVVAEVMRSGDFEIRYGIRW